jgi:hypothetical protein
MSTENKEAGAAGAGGENTSSQNPDPKAEKNPQEGKQPSANAKAGGEGEKKEGAKAPSKDEAGKEGTTAKAKVEPKSLGDDEEIPEDAELFTLSRAALQKRLARNTKKELRERFGTDDLDSIKQKLDNAEKYEAEQEKLRRAQLTREERLKEDRDREKKRADEAEAKLQVEQDRVEVREVDTMVRKILPKFVDGSDESMDFAMFQLKRHVASLDDDDLNDPEKVVASWAKEFAKKYPKHAKAGDEGESGEKTAKEIPLTTGTKPQRPEPMKGANEKDPRPGKQNSMSKTEYADYKRRLGLSRG